MSVTSASAQPLIVQALRNGNAQAGFALTGLTRNAWTQVTIPLATLGVAEPITSRAPVTEARRLATQPVSYRGVRSCL